MSSVVTFIPGLFSLFFDNRTCHPGSFIESLRGEAGFIPLLSADRFDEPLKLTVLHEEMPTKEENLRLKPTSRVQKRNHRGVLWRALGLASSL